MAKPEFEDVILYIQGFGEWFGEAKIGAKRLRVPNTNLAPDEIRGKQFVRLKDKIDVPTQLPIFVLS